jgi:hypothetical protein
MIRRAVDGHYDDYLSEFTFPLMALVRDLSALAAIPATPRDSRPLLRDLIRQVKAGEFRGSNEEARAWMASPEGLETMREMAAGELPAG